MSYPLGIPPHRRCHIDYVFILRESVITCRKRIYVNYAFMFDTFQEFCTLLDSCTENYECLVIDNNTRSKQLEDRVFWYRAELHENFRLGGKEFWEQTN